MYAAGRNRFTNNIDLLNLYGGKHREIVLEPEGANGVSMSFDFCFSRNQFVVKERERVTVIDFDGKVINRFPIKDLALSDDSIQYRLMPFGAIMAGTTPIEAYDHKAFISLTPLSTKPISASIGAVLDIEDNNFSLLPIDYPECILSKKDVLDAMGFPLIMPYQDRLVFSFPCSSRVYVYNRLSGQITDFKMNSLFIEDEIDVPAIERYTLQKSQFEGTTARYREVRYSPNLHKYYRFALGEKEYKGDREQFYLVIYDEHTKESKEYQLPSSLSEYQYVVYNDVLYVAYRNDTDDVFNFAKIDIATL